MSFKTKNLIENSIHCLLITGHANSSTEAIYVELQTEEGASILLSRGHLIHVGSHGKLKAAPDVAIGDTVFVTVDFRLRPAKVTGVTEVLKRGAYCPHTTGELYISVFTVRNVVHGSRWGVLGRNPPPR